MRQPQERVFATIPLEHEWHTEDIEQKAKELNITKGDFLLKAIDLMLHFDPYFLNLINSISTTMKVPEWLVIQNFIIAKHALNTVKIALNIDDEPIKEFKQSNNGFITGEKLYKILLKEYTKEFSTDDEKEIKVLNEINSLYTRIHYLNDKINAYRNRFGSLPEYEYDEKLEENRALEYKQTLNELSQKQKNLKDNFVIKNDDDTTVTQI